MEDRSPSPTELLLYPHATMSEAAAEAILPTPRLRGEHVSFITRNLHEFLEGAPDRVAVAALSRWFERRAAAERAAEALAPANAERPVFDSASYYLIHGTNSSTPGELTTEYDLLPERLERAGVAKQRSNLMAAHLWDTENAVAQKLATCNTFRVFRHWLETGDTRLVSAICCKQDRLCPVCAHLRSARNAARYHNKIMQLVAQDHQLSEWLWTFTVKDGTDLSERLDHLKGAMRLLIDHRRKVRNGSSRNKWFPFAAVAGGVYSVELTIGRNSRAWHPHVHIFALHDSDHVPFGETPHPSGTRCPAMEAWWLERTGDSFIVDIRPIAGTERGSACLEVLKYATKFSAMTLEENVIAWRASAGRRLMQSFGILSGVQECEVLTDELSMDEGEFLDLHFRFDGERYRQVGGGDCWHVRELDQVSPQGGEA